MIYSTLAGGFVGMAVGLLLHFVIKRVDAAGLWMTLLLGFLIGGVIGSQLPPLLGLGALLGFISGFMLCAAVGFCLLESCVGGEKSEFGGGLFWMIGLVVIQMIAAAAGIFGALIGGWLTHAYGFLIPTFLGRAILVEIGLLLVWGTLSWGYASYRAARRRAVTEQRQRKRRDAERGQVPPRSNSRDSQCVTVDPCGLAVQSLSLLQPLVSGRSREEFMPADVPGSQVSGSPPMPLLELALRIRQVEAQLPELLGSLLYPGARLAGPPSKQEGVPFSSVRLDTPDQLQTVIDYYVQVVPNGKRTPTGFVGSASRPIDSRETTVRVMMRLERVSIELVLN